MNRGVELRSFRKEVAYPRQHSSFLPSLFIFFICVQIPVVGSSIRQDGLVAHVVDEPTCYSPYFQPASDDLHVVMPADIRSNQYTCRLATNANHTTKSTDIVQPFIIPKTYVPVLYTYQEGNYSHSKGDDSNQNQFLIIEYKMYFAPILKKKRKRQIKSRRTGTRKKRIVTEQKQCNKKYEHTSNDSPPYTEEAQPFYSSTSTCRGGGRSKKLLPYENMVASSQKLAKTQEQKTLHKDDLLPNRTTTPVNNSHSEHNETEVNAATSGYVSGKDQQKQPASVTTNYEETTVTTSDDYSLLKSRAPCTEESSRLPEVKECVLDSTMTGPSEIVLERHRESSSVAVECNLPAIWPVPVEVVDKNVSDELENHKPQANENEDVKYENESFLDTGSEDEGGWIHKEDSGGIDVEMKSVIQPFSELGPSPPQELCEYNTGPITSTRAV